MKKASNKSCACGHSCPRVSDLPIVQPALSSEDGFTSGVAERSRQILAQRGAVLLRGFEIKDAAGFRDCLVRLGLNPIETYSLGPEPRVEHAPGIFTSTERSGDFLIHLHNEVSYKLIRPHYLAFACMRPSALYGETPICNFARVFADLPQDLQHKLLINNTVHQRTIIWRELGVEDTSGRFQGGTSNWSAGMTREEVEAHFRLEGVDYEWIREGVRTYAEVPTVVKHPEKGFSVLQTNMEYWHPSVMLQAYRRFSSRTLRLRPSLFHLLACASWFPQLIADNVVTRLQLGSRRISVGKPGNPALTVDECLEIGRRIWEHVIVFPWQKRDVLVVDNLWYAHGRLNVPRGADRLILTGMCDPHKIARQEADESKTTVGHE